jgi:hypothetical protein
LFFILSVHPAELNKLESESVSKKRLALVHGKDRGI